MAIQTTIRDTTFGVGDVVRVSQKITDIIKGEQKSRTQVFEGTVIAIRGKGIGKTFIVRRIGAQKVGIEQIFPQHSPNIEKVEVVRAGKHGARQGKLYYIRDKSKREIETIYTRAKRRGEAKKHSTSPKKATLGAKKAKPAPKKTAKKTSKAK